MAALPYMPLYVADYMADAAHLSMEEHGAYLLLIMTYWQRGKAIEDNDERMARICRTSVEQWLNVRSTIVEFFEIEDGFWVHNRIENELEKVRNPRRPKFAEWQRLRELAFGRDGRVCSYCRDQTGPFEIDHVIPVCRGGSNNLDNLAVSCCHCNRSKGALTGHEFLQERGV